MKMRVKPSTGGDSYVSTELLKARVQRGCLHIADIYPEIVKLLNFDGKLIFDGRAAGQKRMQLKQHQKVAIRIVEGGPCGNLFNPIPGMEATQDNRVEVVPRGKVSGLIDAQAGG
jgi:hypothetical protein